MSSIGRRFEPRVRRPFDGFASEKRPAEEVGAHLHLVPTRLLVFTPTYETQGLAVRHSEKGIHALRVGVIVAGWWAMVNHMRKLPAKTNAETTGIAGLDPRDV